MRVPFVFQDIEHWTLPDLIETVRLIDGQQEADNFIQAYAEIAGEDNARRNLGYIARLISDEDPDGANTIKALFGVEFEITPRHAFGATSYGIQWDGIKAA